MSRQDCAGKTRHLPHFYSIYCALNYLTFREGEQIRFFLAGFSALSPSPTWVQIKRGASAVCRSRNVGLRQSRAEQRDAPGELEATLCCSRARELSVWQPCALSGHTRTTATVFSGHLHYSKINALSILCLPTLDMCAASLLPQPKVGSPPPAARHATNEIKCLSQWCRIT